MRLTFPLSLLILAIAFTGCPEPDPHPDPEDAYAPVVDPPAAAQENPHQRELIRSLETAPIPVHDEVRIPAYPQARIAASARGGEIRTEQRVYRTLPVMTLLTTDPMEQVVQFYRQHLQGWQERETGATHWFWYGPAQYDPTEPQMANIAAVGIWGAEATLAGLMPGAQTEIEIRYDPTGEAYEDPGAELREERPGVAP